MPAWHTGSSSGTRGVCECGGRWWCAGQSEHSSQGSQSLQHTQCRHRVPLFLLLTWEGDSLSGVLMFLWAPQSVDVSDLFQLFLAAAPGLAAAQWVAGWFIPWKMRS